MQKERFWFGVALFVVPAMLLLPALGPPTDNSRSGPVEGHVSIHGRPMTGGYILFVPQELELNSAVGRVDEKGHYSITPRWDRKLARGETRFRICLIPKVTTNMASRSLERLSDPTTSDLEVRLDSGPAQVDIAL